MNDKLKFNDLHKSFLCELNNTIQDTVAKHKRFREGLLNSHKKYIVTFNIGGAIHYASQSIFDSEPNSMLYLAANASTDDIPKDRNGNIFFDRNGHVFGIILNCLRTHNELYLKSFIDTCFSQGQMGITFLGHLLQDLNFFQLENMNNSARWLLEAKVVPHSIQAVLHNNDYEMHADYAFTISPVSHTQDNCDTWLFQDGPGVSNCRRRFSTSHAVTFTENTLYRSSQISTYGARRFSITVHNPDSFGVGIANYFDTVRSQEDFSRTKHCAMYFGSRGILVNNMCTAQNGCGSSDSNAGDMDSYETQCFVVPKVSECDHITITVNFLEGFVRWMLNGTPMCYTILCQSVNQVKFAVLGTGDTAVEIKDAT